MQYTVEVVEQVTMTVRIEAESREAALSQLNGRIAMREMETINWQTMSTRVLEIKADEKRPYVQHIIQTPEPQR